VLGREHPVMAHLRGGRASTVGGLLGPAPPRFTVPSFAVDAGSICRYSLEVEQRGAGRWVVPCRWSEMETVVREVRELFPALPAEITLPKYYFKTTDTAKLEQRRRELEGFWRALMAWLGEVAAGSAAGLLDEPPLRRLLEGGRHTAEGGGQPEPEPEPEPEPRSRSRPASPTRAGGSEPDRGSASSERCLYSSSRGESVGKADFELITALGEGSFGRVMLCRRSGRGADGTS